QPGADRTPVPDGGRHEPGVQYRGARGLAGGPRDAARLAGAVVDRTGADVVERHGGAVQAQRRRTGARAKPGLSAAGGSGVRPGRRRTGGLAGGKLPDGGRLRAAEWGPVETAAAHGAFAARPAGNPERTAPPEGPGSPLASLVRLLGDVPGGDRAGGEAAG